VPNLLSELAWEPSSNCDRLKKAQSWIYNCETANRRVDVTEFIAWARACGVAPPDAFEQFLHFR